MSQNVGVKRRGYPVDPLGEWEVTMELRLTEHEREVLIWLLEDQQKQLLREIARADKHEFREELRRRCEVVEALLDKLHLSIVTAA